MVQKHDQTEIEQFIKEFVYLLDKNKVIEASFSYSTLDCDANEFSGVIRYGEGQGFIKLYGIKNTDGVNDG